MSHGIQKQVRPLATIESEFHLLQVGREMLCRNLVPSTDYTPLEKRERGFDGVGVNVAPHINLEPVPNRLVASVLAEISSCATVRQVVIREKHIHILTDVLLNEPTECSRLYVIGMEKSKFSAALPDTNHHFLVFILVLMAAPDILSAYEGFIHFYFARKHGTVGLHHRMAYTMAQVPRGFVAHSDGSLNLAGRNAFLRLTEQESGEEPRFERKMRVIENRASGDGELVVALFAIEKLFLGFQFNRVHMAARAVDAFRPAEPNKQLAALLVSRKERVYIN